MFPEKLRALRIGRNLSLAKLANELNSVNIGEGRKNTGPQIGSWERGINVPSYIEVKRLCSFFGVTPNFLIGDSRDKIDLNEIFVVNSQMKFEGKVLTQNEKSEIYGLIKAYIRGKYAETNKLDEKNQIDLKLSLND